MGARARVPLITVRHIGCPVLLVHGQDDPIVPMADAGHESVDRVDWRIPELLDFLDEVRQGQIPLAP